MWGFLVCLILSVVELFAGVAYPAYASLKLVSGNPELEDKDRQRQYKLWSFYWVLIIVVWTVFSYLEWLPLYSVIRLGLTVGLVSPKINLLGKVFDSAFNEGLIKEKIEQVKKIIQEKTKQVQA